MLTSDAGFSGFFHELFPPAVRSGPEIRALMRGGFDTQQIAAMCGAREHEIWRELARTDHERNSDDDHRSA